MLVMTPFAARPPGSDRPAQFIKPMVMSAALVTRATKIAAALSRVVPSRSETAKTGIASAAAPAAISMNASSVSSVFNYHSPRSG